MSDPGDRELLVRWMGRVSYTDAEALQDSLVDARRRREIPDTLLLLEHEPVVTMGRRGSEEHLLWSGEELARRGIAFHRSGRGGDVTYHGPGQLVGYPILALPPARRDAHRYLRDLEEVLLRVASDYGIHATRREGLTGVWVGREKLAAIGVKLHTGWVTAHGFSLNVGADLGGFRAIVPCGIAGEGVTSLARITRREPRLKQVAARAAVRFAEVFDRTPVVPARGGERLAIPGAVALS